MMKLSKLGGKRNAIGSHFLVDLLEVFELEEYNEDSFLQRPLQSLRRRDDAVGHGERCFRLSSAVLAMRSVLPTQLQQAIPSSCDLTPHSLIFFSFLLFSCWI